MNKKISNIMKDAAHRALRDILAVTKSQSLLIVTDDGKIDIGNAFFKAAEKLAGQTNIYVLAAESRPLDKTPDDLNILIKDTDVVINIFSAIAEEIPFRIDLIDKLIHAGKKAAHAPGITAEMMTDGPMNVDFKQMRTQSLNLISELKNAAYVNIKSAAGTNITLNITDRPFMTDTIIENGEFGNLPPGEIACAPVENYGTGILVCDGSVGDLGKVPASLKIELKDGKAVNFECKSKDFAEKCRELLSIDPNASTIAELGIGINKGAKIRGNVLEDEKVNGTAHIAFGDNTDLPGGNNRSDTHIDFVFKNPEMTFTYSDGSKKTMINGKIQK